VKATIPPPEDLPARIDTAETRDIHGTDKKLRGFGFKIHSRPRKGPDLWERHGETFTKEQALKIVEREIEKVATTK
jgi:hypothetical protein